MMSVMLFKDALNLPFSFSEARDWAGAHGVAFFSHALPQFSCPPQTSCCLSLAYKLHN